MKLRILGCGTSTGVPRIGSGWGKCDPAEPRNRRLRSSLLVETDGQKLLIDCGPDLREQMLAAACDRLDGVIVTHDHADHCHGIDELRPLAKGLGRPIPLHARAPVLQSLEQRFGYIFRGSGPYPAVADAVPLAATLRIADAELTFADQPHGKTTSLGIRIEEGRASVGYAIDFSAMTEAMKALYQGVDVWICDCLQREPHPTHAHLEAVLGWARDFQVGALYLTHMNNSMDYQTLVRELPDWAAPAHDGLEIEL